MQDQVAVDALKDFVARYSDAKMRSTAATVVNYSGDLYNVEGSTDDPKINGVTWKQLLINNGINGPCYADTPVADAGSSHPSFNVGGHMTPNSDGSVTIGGNCYLMPLCSWHNSTARDGMPFSHTQTTMLQLSGYMQAEPAATFVARQITDAPYALVGAEGGVLGTRSLQEAQLPKLKGELAATAGEPALPQHYVLLKRVVEAGVPHFVIEDSRLP